jgi:hypothetical protein
MSFEWLLTTLFHYFIVTCLQKSAVSYTNSSTLRCVSYAKLRILAFHFSKLAINLFNLRLLIHKLLVLFEELLLLLRKMSVSWYCARSRVSAQMDGKRL